MLSEEIGKCKAARRLALAAAALALGWAAPAAAGTCTAANTYNFAFSSAAAATLSYSNSYSYTATTSGGASQNFTLSFATNGLSSSIVSSGSNLQMPAIGNLITGSGTGNTLNIGGTFSGRTDTTFTNRVIKVTFTFATPIRDMTLRVHDIDFTSDQYRDWLMVEGFNGASTYAPTLSLPAGGSATAVLGPNATYASLTAGQALGTAANTNTGSNLGDVAVSFTQPVTSVTVRYGNYPYTGKEKTTGQQAMGISAIGFCPMPNVTMAKTSAPLATSGTDRFGIPGADIVYTITVTNSGASPVDAASIVLTDTLPSQARFYNADFDTSLPGTGAFYLTAGSSGVTLAASNVTYSSNGSTYGYTPASGYDANVKAVKLQPQGTMAANSSFAIQYRVQIK